MNTIATTIGILLALICTASALMDFTKNPKIVESLAAIGVPESKLVLLGVLKLAGAAGIIIGFSRDWLAVVSGMCLSAYFLIAVATHVRAKDDMKNAVAPLVLMAMAAIFTLTTLAK